MPSHDVYIQDQDVLNGQGRKVVSDQVLVPSSSRSGVRRPKPEAHQARQRERPVRCRFVSKKVLVWGQGSNFLENPVALRWCVFDGVTATVSGMQGIKTLGVETGDEIGDCIATFATSVFGSIIEVHAVCNSEKAFGSGDNDGWMGVTSGEVFEVVLFIGCQGSERIFVKAWHVKRLHP